MVTQFVSTEDSKESLEDVSIDGETYKIEKVGYRQGGYHDEDIIAIITVQRSEERLVNLPKKECTLGVASNYGKKRIQILKKFVIEISASDMQTIVNKAP